MLADRKNRFIYWLLHQYNAAKKTSNRNRFIKSDHCNIHYFIIYSAPFYGNAFQFYIQPQANPGKQAL